MFIWIISIKQNSKYFIISSFSLHLIYEKKRNRKRNGRKQTLFLHKMAIINCKMFSIPRQSTQCILTCTAAQLNSNSENQVCVTGEDEIIEWNYDPANENNTTIVHMPHNVDAPFVGRNMPFTFTVNRNSHIFTNPPVFHK